MFSEDFEGRDPFAGWTDRKTPECVRLSEDVPHSGNFALAIEADIEGQPGRPPIQAPAVR